MFTLRVFITSSIMFHCGIMMVNQNLQEEFN